MSDEDTTEDKIKRAIDKTPACGKDFCDTCGDCLNCYAGDGCVVGDQWVVGEPYQWVVYDAYPDRPDKDYVIRYP
jgi:hypothetical protein